MKGEKMDGYLMTFRRDGTPTSLGKVTEINTITESPTPEPPLVHIADDTEFTMTVTLTKKNKIIWAKMLNMPKYKMTEWIFPRKKKRGTKRRIRKAYRQLSKIFELEKKTWMI